MKPPLLKVRNLSVAFHDQGGPSRVVDGVSFDLYEKEIVGLVGESGCGKSVTARALMGLLPSHIAETDSSCMQLAGTELSRLGNRGWQKVRGAEMAMVFQEPATALDPVFTIGQQISSVTRRHLKQGKAASARLALDALEQAGFTRPGEVYDAYPHQLSGGMRQLVMIAMAMAAQPRLLIADEPTTALDVSTQSQVIEQLLRLRDHHGTTILLVTHDLGVVAQCCSRAMVMYCGRLVEQAEYRDLYRHPRHPYSYGLLSSVPRIGEGKPVHAGTIPGRVPAPSEIPPGCHFADRCARADELCRQKYPPLDTIGKSRVACHHPLEHK